MINFKLLATKLREHGMSDKEAKKQTEDLINVINLTFYQKLLSMSGNHKISKETLEQIYKQSPQGKLALLYSEIAGSCINEYLNTVFAGKESDLLDIRKSLGLMPVQDQ